MKVKRQLIFLSIALTAVSLLSSVHAAPTSPPAGSKTLQANLDNVEFYSLTTMLAEVDSYVWKYTSGDYEGNYLYTYQITGKSIFSLSFFSISVLEDATFYEIGYESGGVEPALWLPIGAPPQSVDAVFGSAIDYGENSALLWFVSNDDYTSTAASVVGTYLGDQASASDELYSPVPEPATLVMLGLGSLFGLIRRKRK